MDFKPIRNKLKNLTFDSVTEETLSLLKEIETNEKLKLPFWHLLLLLKWNLEFSKKNIKAKKANKNDIVKLLNQLEKLESSHKIFNPNHGVFKLNKGLTILAHQQFLYQNNAWWDTFARQLILFIELSHKYDVQNSFEELTKVKLTDFINISFLIYLTSFESHKFKPEGISFTYKGYITKIFLI